MTTLSVQLVTSCKPKPAPDQNPSSSSTKSQTRPAPKPIHTVNSPELQKLVETSDPEERTKLVLQLGEQKVVEAVPYLVSNVAAIKAPHVYNAMDWNNGYPCSTALAQIGDVAVPQIKSQFTKATSGVDQMILLHTLIRIKGAQFVTHWLETLKTKDQTVISEDRLNELKKWVASQIEASSGTVRQATK